jgi:predicted O-methyltransferase YrrM
MFDNIFYTYDEPIIDFDPVFEDKRNCLHMVAQRCTSALEIGFHGGYSAFLMITANANLSLIANDNLVGPEGFHPEVYGPIASKALSDLFVERFQYAKGDLEEMIPRQTRRWINESHKFDLVYMNGPKKTLYKDVKTLLPVLISGAYIIFNDTEIKDVLDVIVTLMKEKILTPDIEFPSIKGPRRYEVLRYYN